jgi:hypothetical protein
MNPARLGTYLFVAFCLCALIWLALLPVTVPVAAGPESPLLAGNLNDLNSRIPDSSARRIDGIARGIQVTQELPAPTDIVAGLGVLLSTYARLNQGKLQITLDANTDGRWENLATRSVQKGILNDTQFYTIEFSPPLHVTAGQMLRISLATDDDASQAVSWWTDPDWQPAGYALRVNGAQIPGTGIFMLTTYRRYDHLYQAAGLIWSRATIFLNTSWRIVLAIAVGAGVIGLLFAAIQILRPQANADRRPAGYDPPGDDTA